MNRFFAVDTRIRFVAVFDAEGLPMGMKMRSGVSSLTPRSVDETLIPAMVGTGLKLSDYVGGFKRAQIDYEKVRLIFLSDDHRIVVVSVEPRSPTSLIDKIAKALRP